MDVQTQHQIVSFGADRMMLFDNIAGTVVVDCTRDANGQWVATAPNVPDVTVAPDDPNTDGFGGAPTYRQGAITAMINQALASLAGAGYSTLVPHGLPETP